MVVRSLFADISRIVLSLLPWVSVECPSLAVCLSQCFLPVHDMVYQVYAYETRGDMWWWIAKNA